jgi:hypothetical protein
MSDELSALNFQQDLAGASLAEDAKRWKIETAGPLEVYVSLASIKDPANVFQARLCWKAYPGEPPSLKFRDPKTGSLTSPSAWPLVRGFRPQTLDACVSWCAEGHALHPEWRNDPKYRWVGDGNALLGTIRRLQSELDFHYSGKYGG